MGGDRLTHIITYLFFSSLREYDINPNLLDMSLSILQDRGVPQG